VKNSTATSRAPGTCMIDGAFQPSNVMSAYARSCTTQMPYSRASPTIFSKKSSSTHCAVGFAGKFRMSILGFGKLIRIVCSSSAKKSTPGTSGIWRMSAPAITGP